MRDGQGISLEKRKEIQLSILKRVHDLCEKNNLYYFLGGGTLIGAVRHKGYIPWDDDIDLMMPREDYNRLLQIINDSKGRLYAFWAGSCPDYPYAYAKISDKCTRVVPRRNCKISRLGLDVEIFPYDGICNQEKIAKFQYKLVGAIQKLRDGLIMAKKEGQELSQAKRIAVKACVWAITKIACVFKVKNCEKVGCVVAVWFGEKEIVKKELFAKRILVDFEQYQFYIPQGYDTYLRNLYGDYMSPPPRKDRRPGHLAKAYWCRGC